MPFLGCCIFTARTYLSHNGVKAQGPPFTPTPFAMSSLVAFASLLTLYGGLSFGLLAGTAELARQSNYQACQRSAIARGVSVDGCSVFLAAR